MKFNGELNVQHSKEDNAIKSEGEEFKDAKKQDARDKNKEARG